MKINLHSHTYYSDGADSPSVMALEAPKIEYRVEWFRAPKILNLQKRVGRLLHERKNL